jgi:hypothetical protein
VPTGSIKLAHFIKNFPVDYVVYDLLDAANSTESSARVSRVDTECDVTCGVGAPVAAPHDEDTSHDGAHKRYFVHVRLAFDELAFMNAPPLMATRRKFSKELSFSKNRCDDDEWHSARSYVNSDGSFSSPRDHCCSWGNSEVHNHQDVTSAGEQDAAARWRAFSQVAPEKRRVDTGCWAGFGFRVKPVREDPRHASTAAFMSGDEQSS